MESLWFNFLFNFNEIPPCFWNWWTHDSLALHTVHFTSHNMMVGSLGSNKKNLCNNMEAHVILLDLIICYRYIKEQMIRFHLKFCHYLKWWRWEMSYRWKWLTRPPRQLSTNWLSSVFILKRIKPYCARKEVRLNLYGVPFPYSTIPTQKMLGMWEPANSNLHFWEQNEFVNFDYIIQYPLLYLQKRVKHNDNFACLQFCIYF